MSCNSTLSLTILAHTHTDTRVHVWMTWLMILSSCSQCVWSWSECCCSAYMGRQGHTHVRFASCIHTPTWALFLDEAAGQEQWAACLAFQSSRSLPLSSHFLYSFMCRPIFTRDSGNKITQLYLLFDFKWSQLIFRDRKGLNRITHQLN